MTILREHLIGLRTKELEANFNAMMHGVLVSLSLKDDEKEYIVTLLQDQLKSELACVDLE